MKSRMKFANSLRSLIRSSWVVVVSAAALMLGDSVSGQETPATEAPAAQASQESTPATVDEETQKRYAAFEEMLKGVKLTGRFSIIGRDGGRASNEEEYYISRVTKSAEGDFWVFNARIKYGDNDYTIPLPIEVKWAGDTPVVTMTDFTILGQGPFSARVVFYDGKYAGTWSHGEVTGHLIGTYEKADAPE